MERDLKLTEKVRKYSIKIGADIIGFADVKYFNKFQKYNQPENYLNNSKTVVVLGLHIFDLVLDAWNINPDNGKNYQFADMILENLCPQYEQIIALVKNRFFIRPNKIYIIT